VFSHEEAKTKGLEIDHDDSHAYKSGKPFALLIHGTQPAGSIAAKMLSALRKIGWTGYSRKVAVALMIANLSIDAVPYEFWPVWSRPGNEWIIKHRVLTCQNHV
jgi:hypothetical protein